jgi:hypothetical protein
MEITLMTSPTILPFREIKQDKLIMYYTKLLENKSKYVAMRDEDKNYILFWFARSVHEIGNRCHVESGLLNLVTKTDNDLPRSTHFDYNNTEIKVKNSVFSFMCGLLSNIDRNATQDFAHKQIKHIENVFNSFVVPLWNNTKLNNEIGYSHTTRNLRNEPPKLIKIKEV